MLEYAMLPFDIMQERIRKRKKGKKKYMIRKIPKKKKHCELNNCFFVSESIGKEGPHSWYEFTSHRGGQFNVKEKFQAKTSNNSLWNSELFCAEDVWVT